MKFMERWFRKETNEKQKSDDLDNSRMLFGPDYEPPKCSVM
jgi:hypothetical protein